MLGRLILWNIYELTVGIARRIKCPFPFFLPFATLFVSPFSSLPLSLSLPLSSFSLSLLYLCLSVLWDSLAVALSVNGMVDCSCYWYCTGLFNGGWLYTTKILMGGRRCGGGKYKQPVEEDELVGVFMSMRVSSTRTRQRACDPWTLFDR